MTKQQASRALIDSVFATGLFDSVERNITSEGYIVSFTSRATPIVAGTGSALA
jgi:hypothetical protein